MTKPIKYILSFVTAAISFIALDSVFPAPLSLSMYVALLYVGAPPLPLAAVYAASSFVGGSLISITSSAVQALLIGVLFLVYDKNKRNPGVEIVVYVFISSIVYILFDGRAPVLKKLVYMAVICLFSATCSVFTRAAKTKGVSIRFDKSETLCAAATVLIVSVGLLKLCGADLYKGISAFLILSSVLFLDDEAPAILSLTLGGAFVWAYGEITYLLPYFFYYLSAYSFMKTGRAFAAVTTCAVEIFFAFVLGFYGGYGYLQTILFCAPCLIFALLPQKILALSDGNGYLSAENAVTKNSLNAFRRLAAARLSASADSFAQMNYAVTGLATRSPSDDALAAKISEEVVSACKKCENYSRCAAYLLDKSKDVEKIAKIGLAKKRITIIDLPKSFLDLCRFPSNVIFEVNRLIDGFGKINEQGEKTEKIRSILALLSKGMEKSVADLADGFSAVYSTDVRLEKKIVKELKRSGVKTKGLMLKKRDETAEITLLFNRSEFNEKRALSVFSQVFSYEFTKGFVTDISVNTVAATYYKKPTFSCAYGVGAVTKFSSPKSGDMHSVTEIGNGKVLFALSDGMGSGEGASATSVSAIELIEAFYRAGFRSETVLPLVNKILSSMTEDDFSAVDICVFDENSGDADFLKIGAPYGFILSKEGIRYLEGSSLPIGILDVLTPTVASTSLKKGDVVILLSDGVTDAFSSSSDVIEYLKTAPVYNPQELADDIIKRALSFSNGVAADDMTAVCVRVV